MLHFELDRGLGLLFLKPEGALSADDFAALTRTIDPYLEQPVLAVGLRVGERREGADLENAPPGYVRYLRAAEIQWSLRVVAVGSGDDVGGAWRPDPDEQRRDERTDENG